MPFYADVSGASEPLWKSARGNGAAIGDRDLFKDKKIKKGLEIYPMGVYNKFRIKKDHFCYGRMYGWSGCPETAVTGKETGRGGESMLLS